jgi:hypothetical protein
VLNSLGDVLFVRQNDHQQREVQALLEALRKHARQTFVNDPSQHLNLRKTLGENISVDFKDTPLETAVASLAKLAKIDIRLDVSMLRHARIREREPVTLKLTERRLNTILQALTSDLKLTWILRDGVLWITTTQHADQYHKTAVYDVRDLCRNEVESYALVNAITAQTLPSSWSSKGGSAKIEFAKPGTLIITHQERIQMEVLDLLETYRKALRSSKPRKRDEIDPNEVITVYYRVYANTAPDLVKLLSQRVQPDSWKDEKHPDAIGEILVVASAPDVSEVAHVAEFGSESDSESQGIGPVVVLQKSVLIVEQTRAAHDQIAEVIRRVESGDSQDGGFGGGGGGLGGSGFGGGFFSIPQEATSP